MSTAPTHSTTFAKSIVYDPESGDHAMYLDGDLVGFARTEAEAEITLKQLIDELVLGTSPTPDADTLSATKMPYSADAPPLPPIATIAETLSVLAAHDDDGAIYALAAQHLAAGVTITAAGEDRLINGVLVRHAPLLERWPWPWRCACGEERCWHGALVESILVAWERLAEDPRPLPFDAAA